MSTLFFFRKKIDPKTETNNFIKIMGKFKKLKSKRGDLIILYLYFFSLIKLEPLLSSTKNRSKFSFSFNNQFFFLLNLK